MPKKPTTNRFQPIQSFTAALLYSTNKRELSHDAAKQLREAVNSIAGMFEKAEGDKASTYRKNWL
jgi:hypothetical protein